MRISDWSSDVCSSDLRAANVTEADSLWIPAGDLIQTRKPFRDQVRIADRDRKRLGRQHAPGMPRELEGLSRKVSHVGESRKPVQHQQQRSRHPVAHVLPFCGVVERDQRSLEIGEASRWEIRGEYRLTSGR